MQIQYQNSISDVGVLRRALPLRWQLLYRYSTPLLMVAAGLPGTLLLAILGDWKAIGLAWLFQVLVGLLTWQRARIATKSFNQLVEKQSARLELHADGVEVEQVGQARFDWSIIQCVQETDDYFLLFVSLGEAYIVPKTAFASPADAAAFISQVRSYFARSREPGYVPYSPPQPAQIIEDAPGIKSAVEIEYQNTLVDLATVHQRGLFSHWPPWIRPQRWLPLAAVACLLGATSRLRYLHPGWGLAYSLFDFLLLDLAVFLLFGMFASWLSVRLVPAQRLERRIVTIGPSGVSLYTRHLEHHCAWSLIAEIAENERFVVVYLARPRHLAIIPKIAFRSEFDAREFVQLAWHWKAVAAEQMAAENAPVRLDSGNPYQTPQQV